MNSIRKFLIWWNRPNKSIISEYLQAFILIGSVAFIIRTWGYGLYQVPTGSMETTMLIGERFFSDKFTYTFLSSPKRKDIIAFNMPLYEYSENPIVNWWQRYVWGPENWTKRIIGIPGDHVQGKIENNKPVVYLNGEKLNEPYLNKYPLIPVSPVWDSRSYDPAKSYEDQEFYKMDGMYIRQIKRIFEASGIPTEKMPDTPLQSVHGSDIYDVYLKENQYWVMGDNRLGSADARYWGHPLDGKLIHGKIVFRLFSVDSDASWWIFDLLLHPIDFWKKIRWSRCFQFVK